MLSDSQRGEQMTHPEFWSEPGDPAIEAKVKRGSLLPWNSPYINPYTGKEYEDPYIAGKCTECGKECCACLMCGAICQACTPD